MPSLSTPSTIRPLTKPDLDDYVAISRAAYPGIQRSVEDVRAHVGEEFARPEIKFMGLFQRKKLMGVMRLYDFTMTVRDQQIPVGGVGGVAVDLLHKKQRVAYKMMQYFLHHCRKQEQTMALLYPFRPDFYGKMGFGYGTPLSEYRVSPEAMPRQEMHHVRAAGEDETAALVACYNRAAQRTHGMIRRQVMDMRHLWQNDARVLVYDKGSEGEGGIEGYLSFRFVPASGDSFLRNNLQVVELIHETPEALGELLSFLHVQRDQIERVIFHSQDEYLYHLFEDPRNDSQRLLPSVYHETSTAGVGWMVRVVDVPGYFHALKETNWGCGGFTLALEVTDDFLPENEGRTLINFDRRGRARLSDNASPSVTLRIGIAQLSSLLLGIVPLSWLVQNGQTTIDSPPHIPALERAFRWSHKPICLTSF